MSGKTEIQLGDWVVYTHRIIKCHNYSKNTTMTRWSRFPVAPRHALITGLRTVRDCDTEWSNYGPEFPPLIVKSHSVAIVVNNLYSNPFHIPIDAIVKILTSDELQEEYRPLETIS